jgi:hypothetical protein
MRDPEIDDILNRAAGASPEVDPALLDRVSQSIGASLRPVRPLPPSWILVSALAAVSVAVAVGGAARLGLYGIQEMRPVDMGLIFPVLGILVWLAAAVCVSEMIPGSRRRIAPGVLLAAACVALTADFAVLFHDYSSEDFVAEGVVCLKAGLLHAVPAALLSWLVLRRGFAVDSVAAGFAIGTLSGLAGVSMLELHCPYFEAPHVMVWHTAVLLVSGLTGVVLVWAGRLFRRR